MRQRLSEPSQLDWIYDLSAVLIHKGTAVNSGHYIAHIKDEITGLWWEFDDEHVSNLGHHPFGEGSSSSTAKGVQSEPAVHPTCPEGMHPVANGSHIDVVQPQTSESTIGGHAEKFSSSDAYMLMYNLRRTRKNDQKGPMVQGANNIKLESQESSLHDGFSLPSHLFKDIKDLNASYLDACKEYKLKKEKEVYHITERKQEVRSVLSEAPVQSLEEPFYWVTTDWLRQWADNIMPP